MLALIIKSLEGNNDLDLLHRGSYQGEISSWTTAVGWVWPGVTSQSQTYLDLSRVNLIGLGGNGYIKNNSV